MLFQDNHLNNYTSIRIALLSYNAKYLLKHTLKYNNFLNFLEERELMINLIIEV